MCRIKEHQIPTAPVRIGNKSVLPSSVQYIRYIAFALNADLNATAIAV